MRKRVIPALMLTAALLFSGCTGSEAGSESVATAPEMSVTEAVNGTDPTYVSEDSSTSAEEIPPEMETVPEEPEVDYAALWADLLWPVEKIEKTILYATTTVNMREEPNRKAKVLGTLEYNDEVVAIGRVNNYSGDKLDFYLLETGEYVCTDYFEALVNVPDLGEGGLVYYDGLYTYENMLTDIDELEGKYPDRVKAEALGTTADGRLICGIRLGQPSDKTFLIMASIHADEYINTPLCMEQIDMYLQNWDVEYADGMTYGDILNSCNLYFIPCVNPDGMTLVQLGTDGLLTEEAKENVIKAGYKNFWTSNINGVDLNRNWDAEWNNKKAESSLKPSAAYYPGRKAFTENETKAIRDWVNKNKTLCGVISFHNQGRIIYWYTNQSEKSNTYTTCKKMAKRMAYLTGYSMGNEDKVIVRGMEYNWFNLKKNIPCIQIETGRGENPLPYSEWRTIWRDNKYVGIEAAYMNK